MLEDSNHLREHLRKLYLFMPQTDTGIVEVLLHSLTSALDGGKRSTWRPGKFTRGKNTSTIEQEAGWTLQRSAWSKEARNLLHFPGQDILNLICVYTTKRPASHKHPFRLRQVSKKRLPYKTLHDKIQAQDSWLIFKIFLFGCFAIW